MPERPETKLLAAATQGDRGANKCFTRLDNRDGIGGKWWQWWWPVIIGTREKKEGHVLRGRRSTFLVGLKRESRVRPSRALLVQCAPRSCRMSQSVTATAPTILCVHTRSANRTTRHPYNPFSIIFFFFFGCPIFIEHCKKNFLQSYIWIDLEDNYLFVRIGIMYTFSIFFFWPRCVLLKYLCRLLQSSNTGCYIYGNRMLTSF